MALPEPLPAVDRHARPPGGLAIVALVAAFVVPLAGIVIGHIALGRIARTGEGGHGLALAGTILGYVFTALWILGAAGYVYILAGEVGY